MTDHRVILRYMLIEVTNLISKVLGPNRKERKNYTSIYILGEQCGFQIQETSVKSLGNLRLPTGFLVGYHMEPWCFHQVSVQRKRLRSDSLISLSAVTCRISRFPEVSVLFPNTESSRFLQVSTLGNIGIGEQLFPWGFL